MSKPNLTGGFDQPFQEQVDFFRQKLNLPTEAWDDIWQEAHDRAFVVAGAMKADLLDDLRQAVDKAISQGTSLETFRKDFAAIVGKHGWQGWTGEGTPGGFAWRTRVIYETNLRSSYAAGRWEQLNDPGLAKLMPYWRYVHNESVLHPRPLHQAWGASRLTLPRDHPFWKTHFPPNGWGCRCRVTAVPAPRKGDATEPPAGWDIPDDTGKLPGIDKGWAYAPGANVQGELEQLVKSKAKSLPPPIAKDFSEDMAKVGKRYWDAKTATGRWHDQAFANAPDIIKGLIERAGDVPLIKMTPRAHPHCSWNHSIEMDGLKPDATRAQSTWRHEYGHWVDGKLAVGRHYFSQGDEFTAAMKADAKAIIDAGGHGRAGKAQAERVKKLAAAYESAAQELAEAADRQAWLAERFSKLGLAWADVEGALVRHTDFANTLQGVSLHARYARVAVAMEQRDAQGLLDALSGGRGEWAESSAAFAKGCLGSLSDLIGSATRNKVGGYSSGFGHSNAYYAKAAWRQNVECYANLFCLYGEGGLFWKSILHTLVPSMLEVFLSA